jgi:hypothetical protein
VVVDIGRAHIQMKYFEKQGTGNYWFKDGTKLDLSAISSCTAVAALDEIAFPDKVLELESAAKGHVGGIVSLTEERYEMLKKKLEAMPPRPQEPSPFKLFDPSKQFQNIMGGGTVKPAREPGGPEAPVVEVDAPGVKAPAGPAIEPEVIPAEKFIPKTGRIPVKKASAPVIEPQP